MEWGKWNEQHKIVGIYKPWFYLLTCCCCTKAALAVPLLCALQRDFGIKTPLCESTCPTKGMGRGPVGVDQRNHIAQQLYFDDLSFDLDVVSCCQVNDAMIGGGCCVLCNILDSCSWQNLIFWSFEHTVFSSITFNFGQNLFFPSVIWVGWSGCCDQINGNEKIHWKP